MIRIFEEYIDQFKVNIHNLSKIEILGKEIIILFKEIFEKSTYFANWCLYRANLAHPHIYHINFHKDDGPTVFSCSITLTPIFNSFTVECYDYVNEFETFMLFLSYVISEKYDNKNFVYLVMYSIEVDSIDNIISKLNIDNYKLFCDTRKYNL